MGNGEDAEDPGQREAPRRPAYLELFFDLAYVVALIMLAIALADDLTWTNAGRMLVLLLTFTMIWSLTVWAADTRNRKQALVQPQVIAVMAGTLLMAAVMREAYGERALLFAVVYVSIHLGSSLYGLSDRTAGAPRVRNLRTLFWFTVSGTGWITGAVLGGTVRNVLWAVAVTVEYAAAVLGWPIPGRGRSHSQEWRLTAERVAERYRQFVIIALGVSIFITGSTFSRDEYSFARWWALAVVFLNTVLMWRIYIYRAGEMMTTAIATSAGPARLTQFTALTHLIMVLGIVLGAAASQVVIGRPLGQTPAAWTTIILGGPALFLLGRGLFDWTVFGWFSLSRVTGIALLGLTAVVTPLLPPVAVALIAAAVLAIVATSNLITTMISPREPAPPALN